MRWMMPIALMVALGCESLAGLDEFEPADNGSGNSGNANPGGGGANVGGAGGIGGSVGGNGGGGAPPATCFDGDMNGTETDVDCGGQCPKCAVTQMCSLPSDCQTNNCAGGTCECGDSIVISEVKTRGIGNNANDEFVELYNQTNTPLTLDDTWTIDARQIDGATFTGRWTGDGTTIPARGHYLIVGSSYSGPPVGDATLSSGIADNAVVRLKKDNGPRDVVCICDDPMGCNVTAGSGCETNYFTFDAMGDLTASAERRDGGDLGHCVDANNNETDFQLLSPARPENTQSMPVPPAP